MKLWPTGRGAKRRRAALAALLGAVLLTGAEALAPGALPPVVVEVVTQVLVPFAS